MLGIVLSVTSMLLYLTETALQIHLATKHFNLDFTSFIIILSLVTGPLVIVNIISTVLVLRTMDFTGRGCARMICIMLHFLQVGLLWRCLKLILLFDEHDWREFVILRLIHTALQSFPIVILKGSHFFDGTDTTVEVISLVVVSAVSNAIVYSMYNTHTYLFENDDFSEFNVRIRKPFGVLLLTLGTIFLMFSRCGSIMLFLAMAPLWTPLPIGLHFLIYLCSTTLYQFCNEKGSILQLPKNLCFSYLNIFDILNEKNQKIVCQNVFLYSGILIENVIMTGYWMMNNNWNYRYQLGTIVSVILTFLCGMFLKCCSCGYLQNDKFEPFSDATFQLALEIATKKTSEIIVVKQEGQNEIQNHETYGEFENQCSILSLENGYIHKVSKKKTNNSISDKSKKDRLSDKNGSTPSRRKEGIGSNIELASSNSRNTNTLNISDPSNVFIQTTGASNIPLKSAQTMPCLSGKHPELTVRSARSAGRKQNAAKITHSNSLEAKRSFCKSPPRNRKSPLPLFPNECSDFVSNKTFESKHVLSNSVDGYNGSETETSYTESYSYYVDSTDWSSMSFDSAFTWPISNPMTFINLHCLPENKISSTDSVQLWLSRLDNQWEPSFEDESFELAYKDKSCSPAPSSEHTNRSSKYKNYSKENQISNNDCENRDSDILLRPKDALLQFCNAQGDPKTPSYLPYKLSEYTKTGQLSDDNAIVIWHDKETPTTSTVQESMIDRQTSEKYQGNNRAKQLNTTETDETAENVKNEDDMNLDKN